MINRMYFLRFYWLLILNFALTFLTFAEAQFQDTTLTTTDSLLIVDRIVIIGNEHTKPFVIQREMSLQPGTKITKQLLEYDQFRIYSLGLFNRVVITVIPTSEEKANLIVEVSERWYIFPFPVVGIKDRDWKKFYYGAGLLHSNFRGRNEKLYMIFVFGYDPSAEIWYNNPFLSEDGSYSLDAKIAYSKIQNKSLIAQSGTNNFSEQHVYGSFGIGRRIGIHHSFWATLGYEYVKVSEYSVGRTLSSDGIDRFPFANVSYTYDTRDLAEYPAQGSFVRLSITKYGLLTKGIDVVRYATDFRQYLHLNSKLILAGRLFTNNAAGGQTPSYNRVYFGYTERIRGHFKEVVEGENLFGISSELHYQLFEPIFVQLHFLPAEFSILKFGAVAAIFADAGTVWFRGQKFAIDRFARGYGFGIHFLLPYSMVLRTDYALNEIRRGEFIFDLGASF